MSVTKHGEIRTRKRAGIPKRAVRKMARVALQNGVPYYETTGSLRRYVDALRLKDGTQQTRVMLYGTMTFIFKDDTLITAFPMPHKYHKLVAQLRSQTGENNAPNPKREN